MVWDREKLQKNCFLNFIGRKFDFFQKPYVKMIKKKRMKKASQILEKKKRLTNRTSLTSFSQGKPIPFDLG